MRAKKILIINRVFPPTLGATGRVACELALHLRKHGHIITILTTADIAKHDRAKNLDVIRVKTNQKPQSISDYWRVLRKMRKATKALPQQDLVISMTDPPFQIDIGHKIARRLGAKHYHWLMDLYPDLLPILGKDIAPFLYKFGKGLMKRRLRQCDKIIPISNCMERYLSHQGIPKNKMHVIENWPDKYLLEDTDDPKSLMDDSKFRILYAGTIGLAHEFDTVISAAIYFQKTDKDIEFVFTARGRGYSIFKDKCDRAGLNNIRFINPQPSKQLNALMNAGDLHLVTMKNSAAGKLFPSKFYSALASARPVIYIGPAACDIHKKISLSKCGATIRNGEGRMLTNAIENLKNNPDAWFEASESASKLLEQTKPLDQWKQLIERL